MSAPIKGAGRPDTGYRNAEGKRVPSVTTVLGRFKDAAGLMHWAWKLGTDGKDYRKERDNAADAGTLAHAAIEARIHGEEWEPPRDSDRQLVEMARGALASFDEWANQTKVEILETETALVSEYYQFGGTFDAVAVVGGKRLLLDWKSSNKVYPEYISQLAAYRQLLAERGDDVEGAVLLRVGKEFGDFHAHSFPSRVLDVGWEAFEHMRKLYDLDATLKKVAA